MRRINRGDLRHHVEAAGHRCYNFVTGDIRHGRSVPLEPSVSITTFSSREFDQDARGALKAAEKGPVVITDCGRPAHVLLSFEDYQKLAGAGPSLLEALAQKEEGDFGFDPPRMGGDNFRSVDLD